MTRIPRSDPTRPGTVLPQTFAWMSPFRSARGERQYSRHFRNHYGRRMETAAELRTQFRPTPDRPEIVLLWSFSPDRAMVVSTCREYGIDVAHWEDGFFPHYETLHADPLGFCWESSLPRMVFRNCNDRQRRRALDARQRWLQRPSGELPSDVRPPFVLWPLQLLFDKVNTCDLNLSSWLEVIQDFRERLPKRYQLVLKVHPLARMQDLAGLEILLDEAPQIVFARKEADLTALLRRCQAVAGANSSVLYEARLMHHKPIYAYARSWFTNHVELFLPIHHRSACGGRDLDWLEWVDDPNLMRNEYLDDYTDWFLSQLLGRQLDSQLFDDPHRFRQRLLRLSYQSFLKHGEDIFEPE